ncbi:site-2 protease family protein [Chloroflexota bacterium]
MNQIFRWPPGWSTLLLIPALLIGFTVHELAHAVVAFMLGDTSQVERHRLSFNPVRHVSWLGMLAFLLVGLGWAKPVRVDQAQFRIKNRAFGMFLVSISGSAANFLVAALALLAMSVTATVVWVVADASPIDVILYMMAQDVGPDLHGLVVALTYYVMVANLLLAFFNLLPFPPLDGFQAAISLYTLVKKPATPPSMEPLKPSPLEVPMPPTLLLSPAQIHFDIGLNYHKDGLLDEAIARYRQAVAHDEFFGLAYYNQGLAYWQKGRLPLAESAFKAAAGHSDDVGVRLQSDLQLRRLAQADQDNAGDLGDIPPPLELGLAPSPEADLPAPIDPTLAKRVWLRLAIGGAVMISLALSAWLLVTTLVLTEMM